MTDATEFLRKQPKQSRSRGVVDAILQAADEVLARSGDVEGLSLKEVARRAGVGIGSVYDYFANRDGVLGALLQHVTSANFASLEKAVAASRGMPFDEALPLLLDAVLATYLDHPTRTRALALAIARLGWMAPVLRERDRFAHVLADRLCAQHPRVPADRARLVAEVLCDCATGVILGEIYRGRTQRAAAEVREELLAIARQRIASLLG